MSIPDNGLFGRSSFHWESISVTLTIPSSAQLVAYVEAALRALIVAVAATYAAGYTTGAFVHRIAGALATWYGQALGISAPPAPPKKPRPPATPGPQPAPRVVASPDPWSAPAPQVGALVPQAVLTPARASYIALLPPAPPKDGPAMIARSLSPVLPADRVDLGRALMPVKALRAVARAEFAGSKLPTGKLISRATKNELDRALSLELMSPA